MQKVQAFGAPAAAKPLAPMTVERREPGPHEVVLDVLYCGICHSDMRYRFVIDMASLKGAQV